MPILGFATLSLLCVYGLCTSKAFLIIMIAIAAIVSLPGIYLYHVDGCRPEGYNDEGSWTKQTSFWLALLSLISGWTYGLYASSIFRILMGTLAALMFLPGIYLYAVDGCRPEDDEDE